jgi:8-oxo-dGTP pyrophosphatase MutT (NUDIX family)
MESSETREEVFPYYKSSVRGCQVGRPHPLPIPLPSRERGHSSPPWRGRVRERGTKGDSLLEDLKHILADRQKVRIDESSHLPAAVLLLLLKEGGEYHVLFTRRTENLTHHRGQISFPGGAYQNGDRSLLETALRECHEEMGIAPRDVAVLGELDDTLTYVSHYHITPFVGIIPWPYPLMPNPAEIAEVITAPLVALREKASFREEVRVEEGIEVTVPFYIYKGKVIWGATARILKQLLTLFP